MKLWRRIEKTSCYTTVTNVDETGRYEQYIVWPDGGINPIVKADIFTMGWTSIKNFLACRHGFRLVEETENSAIDAPSESL